MMDKIYKAVGSMQEGLNKLQDKMNTVTVSGDAGSETLGKVKITMSALHRKAEGVKIDSKLLHPDQGALLEQLLVTAFNNAVEQAQLAMQEGLARASMQSSDFLKMFVEDKSGS